MRRHGSDYGKFVCLPARSRLPLKSIAPKWVRIRTPEVELEAGRQLRHGAPPTFFLSRPTSTPTPHSHEIHSRSLFLFLATVAASFGQVHLEPSRYPPTMESDALDQMRARHRKELKDLQGRITSKKKNANKKTRKGVNDECEALDRSLREKQAEEIAALEPPIVVEQEEEVHEESRLERLENKVEEKLERAVDKLHISSSNGTSHNEPAGNGTGKKRNRQQERMARRAAEQEEAAQRAEDEASNMTDHRAREDEYMKKMFATYSLSEKDIEPDGHCLFSAVADQLEQNAIPVGTQPKEPPYKAVRREAADWMLTHRDDFAPFLEEELEVYAQAIKDTAEWGGEMELMALARRYEVEIHVIQDGRMEKIGEVEGKISGKVLWLAYYRHGYGLGEHYNSLRQSK